MMKWLPLKLEQLINVPYESFSLDDGPKLKTRTIMAKISTLNGSIKHGNHQMKQKLQKFKITAKYLGQGIKLFQSL